MKKYLIFSLFLYFILPILPAQEALKSAEEDYYDFLALQGLTERPALNYRTLSDSVWKIEDGVEHLWQDQNLGTWHTLFGDFRLRVYGPELFMSGNTAAPYGQNDGVLWQGRGFNALFKGGVRFEGYGVELTLLPHFAFSQNAEFEIMPSAYESEFGYIWGIGYNLGADAPQRFGNKPFFDWDFGDSEIRYTWETLTIGFGTQAIWLGPSYFNSILHSNNAPAYPKLDIGLRRQRVTLPWLGWYIGDVEARIWAGYLRESHYFDNDSKNDHNLLSGLAFAYTPSFIPGLTVYFNEIYLAKWIPESAYTLIDLFLPFREWGGGDEWDLRVSAGFDYFLPQASVNFYAEIGYNDTPAPHLKEFLSNFSHTIAFTAGFKKGIKIHINKKIFGELLFEYTHIEMSPFASQELWANTFYMHHIVTQGHTNRGQWLGAGIGTGGNSQFLAFKIFYPNGSSQVFASRYNPDNDFITRHTTPAPGNPEESVPKTDLWNHKTILAFGVNSNYFFSEFFNLTLYIVYAPILNNHYNYNNVHNFYIAIGNKFSL
jgi:hypothetical protein